MSAEVASVLAWVIGLMVLAVCVVIACIVTAEPIDDDHPEALSRLDILDGVGEALAASDAHELARQERHERTVT